MQRITNILLLVKSHIQFEISKNLKSPIRHLMGAVLTGLILFSCGPVGPANPDDAEDELNKSEAMIMPAGTYRASEDEVTEVNDISVTSSVSDGEPTPVSAGEPINVNINFEAVNGNVTHAGIRFGESGDFWIIPIEGARGETAGILDFQMGLPMDLCQNIDSTCQKVTYYQYAVAEGQNGELQVSEAYRDELVVFCGDCNEPSCQELLTNCEDTVDDGTGDDGGTATGEGTFIRMDGTTYQFSAATSSSDGIPDQILCDYTEENGGMFILHADFVTTTPNEAVLAIYLSSRPTVSKNYTTIDPDQNSFSGTSEAIIEFSDLQGIFRANAGGTVRVIESGGNLTASFSSLTFTKTYNFSGESAGSMMADISGQIVCGN